MRASKQDTQIRNSLARLQFYPAQRLEEMMLNILPSSSNGMFAARHLVPMRLTNMPLWLYLRSVSSSEKSVKL
jgi:hypothetical protein